MNTTIPSNTSQWAPATTVAHLLRNATDDLAADNRKAAKVAEARMADHLLEYIENRPRKYTYGGIVNLLTTIAGIMEAKSHKDGDDWETAARAIEDCAHVCDLKYAEPEHPFSGSCGGD